MSIRTNRLSQFLIAVILLAAFVLPVFANQIQEKHQELDAIKSMQERVQKKIADYKKQEKSLLGELRFLESNISRVQTELRSLNNKIGDTEKKIKVTEDELAAAEEQIAATEDLLAVRLRAIHEHGNISYLEVLFNSTTFTEFLTRYNDLQMIVGQDRELLTEYQAEKERIAAIKQDLEGRRQDLLALRQSNLAKKQELELSTMEREMILTAVRDELDAEEEAIKQLEAEAKQLEEIIKQLQAEAARKGNVYLGTGKYLWPVPEFGPSWITSGFGYRIHPITRVRGSFHGGIDIGVPHNRWPGSRSYIGRPVEVVASDSGIAYTYRMGGGYGNLVIVDHGAGIATVYAHNHNFLVANETQVIRGQAIAIVGSTGASTGPHLHFEIRINGERVDPLPYVR
ncbi:MAG: peptidoglycan DD-metalloendopeptidase family protein [Dethiobacter sp.]|nr:peptidoglycan DD-metalloendopeptidase family protein [Dethiobacter sp.]